MKKIPFYKKEAKSLVDPQPHIVYDNSITDLEERKARAIKFNSATECANYLGIARPFQLNIYTSKKAILSKKRYLDRRTGKEYTIRKI